MCMTFSYLPMDRQEEIYVGLLSLVDRGDVWYAARLPHYTKELTEFTYHEMDTVELIAHKLDLIDAHRGDKHWEQVINLVSAELATRDALTKDERYDVLLGRRIEDVRASTDVSAFSPFGASGYAALTREAVSA